MNENQNCLENNTSLSKIPWKVELFDIFHRYLKRFFSKISFTFRPDSIPISPIFHSIPSNRHRWNTFSPTVFMWLIFKSTFACAFKYILMLFTFAFLFFARNDYLPINIILISLNCKNNRPFEWNWIVLYVSLMRLEKREKNRLLMEALCKEEWDWR